MVALRFLDAVERLGERQIVRKEQMLDQRVLAFEVAVDRAFGDGGGLGDVLRRRLRDALADEEADGGLFDAGLGLVRHPAPILRRKRRCEVTRPAKVVRL